MSDRSLIENALRAQAGSAEDVRLMPYDAIRRRARRRHVRGTMTVALVAVLGMSTAATVGARLLAPDELSLAADADEKTSPLASNSNVPYWESGASGQPMADPCEQDQIQLRLVWRRESDRLAGELTFENIGTTHCSLPSPRVVPFVDGRRVTTQAGTFLGNRPATLLVPGGEATSLLTWFEPCGDSPTRAVAVSAGNWTSSVAGSAPVDEPCATNTIAQFGTSALT